MGIRAAQIWVSEDFTNGIVEEGEAKVTSRKKIRIEQADKWSNVYSEGFESWADVKIKLMD